MMTKNNVFFSVALILSLAAPLAMADGNSPANGGNRPCMKAKKQVIAACKSAGFVKGEAKEGKGLFKDCVGPVMHGKTVSGVNLDSNTQADVQACQQKRSSKKSSN